MVYVNSKKYACEACIKGHRSSSCHHNDRPLYEIKKKGRPVSQCDNCREARQSRRIHAKCTCDAEKSLNVIAANAEGKKKQGKRFIPTVPSLPNGLKDAIRTSSSSSTEVNLPKQPVDALLNPCHCEDVYNCKCRPRANGSGIRLEPRPSKPVDPAIFSDGLSALALVASCCFPATPPILPQLHKRAGQSLSSEKASSRAHTGGDEKPETRLTGSSKRKRPPRSSPVPEGDFSDVNKPKPKAFRPIAPAASETEEETSSTWTNPVSSYPRVPILPSYSIGSSNARNDTDTVLADSHTANVEDVSNCCCGTHCECAGCASHGTTLTTQSSWVDDPAEAAPSSSVAYSPVHGHGVHAHRAVDCPTCVDHVGGIELPPISTMPGVPANSRETIPSYLADFYARAASLPAPPAYNRSSLDPTNVRVYPPGLFKRPRRASESAAKLAEEVEDSARAFGLIRIPKLEECCGGRCGCTENACGCGDKCDGCCMDDRNSDDDAGARLQDNNSEVADTGTGLRLSPSISFARRPVNDTPPPPPISTPSVGPRSCCARP